MAAVAAQNNFSLKDFLSSFALWELFKGMAGIDAIHVPYKGGSQAIIDVAKPLGIAVHDHIIVGRDGHASLKGLKLI